MPSESPTIVAIDTATDVCSVAVLRGELLTELTETVGHRHSERVLPMVDEALAKAGVSLGNVDVFAFGGGPGSFTGLRIACGVAQGLAYGKRKRVVGVGNLRALASNAFAANTTGDLLLAAIDARMNESYCAIYRRQQVSEVRAPALELPQSLAPLAATENVDIVAGNALAVFSAVWPSERSWIGLPDATSSAAAIATLARFDAARGLTVAPEQAAPIYVRDHVAMTIDERRKVSGSRDSPEERAVSGAATSRSAREQH
ncbi:MAG TPA: tRNA (adenosine(37)-N6)-threonylcarbamoyltransferase complex dimerization subunit type 1 TsaB [Burkholderiaceae bacterium]|nr:tRNA (adenosine(37)-N6)-threonylcarbamoyltransferase complex dimerization subunit type 1 TsaB [Burkholderiaceae bacterium]